MTKANSISQAVTKSPILWGLLACGGFYGLIRGGLLDYEMVHVYFASHPVEYVATALFFVGIAALVIKGFEIAAQRQGLNDSLLGPIPPGGQPAIDCEPLANRLNQLPDRRQDEYRVRRLSDGLEHVRRAGNADGLEDELKYLADMDAGRVHAGYGLIRMIVWAIPILGFLGTVIGITLAVAKLSPESLETSLTEVTASLSVAFNTTTLALGLSIVLMFAQFFTEREENRLLDQIDRQVYEELAGRFERISDGPDGQLVAVRRMIEMLVDSTDQLVQRQATLWQASIDAAGERWSSQADVAGEHLQQALAGALADSLKTHARELAATEQESADRNRKNWQRVQEALDESTQGIAGLQEAIIEKAQILGRAVQSTDQVVRLQETLNQNLGALAGSKNFEKTVMSLAAAIHLLNSRLGDVPVDMPSVELDPRHTTGQAA